MDGKAESTVSVRTTAARNVTPLPLHLLRRDAWLQSIIALFVLSYVVSTVVVSRPDNFNTLWDGGVYTVAETLPVIAMILCALRWPAQRAPWLLIGLGVLAHTAGDLVYSFHDQNLIPTPVPADSDVLFFVSYALLVAGVLVLTQHHIGRVSAAVRLEGIVTGIVVASLAALLWFGPALSMSGTLWHVVLADAYPVGNLVLLVLLVSSLAPYGYRPNEPVVLLLAAVAWFVFGDVVYFGQSTTGTYVSRTFLNVTWVMGLWLVQLAATSVSRRRSGALQRNRPTDHRSTWAPVASGFVFLAVIANFLIVPGVDRAAMFLASVGVALLGIDIVLTKRDIGRSPSSNEARDAVTGLITSAPFLEQVGSWLREERDGVVGVVVLDIIDFAGVNEAIGYAIADELLWVIGQRAQYRLGDRGVFARLGGDDFAFATAVSSEQHVVELADTVLHLVADRFRLGDFSVGIVGRVAVATAAPGTTSAADLLARAHDGLTNLAPPMGLV